MMRNRRSKRYLIIKQKTMKNIIIFNILSLINWLCNLLFFILLIIILYWHFMYWVSFKDIKTIWYILSIWGLIWIIIIPPEEELKKIFIKSLK